MGAFVTSKDIERAVKYVAKEDRRYEVPDALGLQDYLHHPELLCKLASARCATGDLGSWRPQPYAWFPYPKAVGGYRKMTTADVVDRVVFRILAFRTSQLTDQALSRHVFGHRLARPGSWSLRPAASAWLDFQRYQLASLSRNDWPYTCVSDLSGFYPAIDTDIMCNSMRGRGVPDELVVPMEHVLRHWQLGGGLQGLPVGGEASAVLSNGYLLPVDSLLGAVSSDHAMFGDDFAIFEIDIPAGRATLDLLDFCLNAELSLTRNVSKTVEFFASEEAAPTSRTSCLRPSTPSRTTVTTRPRRSCSTTSGIR